MNGKGYDELCFTFWYAAFGASDSTQLHVIKADPNSSTGQMVSTLAIYQNRWQAPQKFNRTDGKHSSSSSEQMTSTTGIQQDRW
jgi:hypothetical protein